MPASRPRRAAPAGYSGTPLLKKLGIREGEVVALLGAPARFEGTLGALPAGTRTTRSPRARADMTLWFVARAADLRRGIRGVARRTDSGGLWIIWPKLSSPLARDLREDDVRTAGLAAAMVDFKVCAVDADWSALRFARRKRT